MSIPFPNCSAVSQTGLDHILSDIAGSSGSRGSSGRGAGIATPFYESLQFCDFGRLDIGKDKQDLATLAVRAFQEGYDARFGIARGTSCPSLRRIYSPDLVYHALFQLEIAAEKMPAGFCASGSLGYAAVWKRNLMPD